MRSTLLVGSFIPLTLLLPRDCLIFANQDSQVSFSVGFLGSFEELSRPHAISTILIFSLVSFDTQFCYFSRLLSGCRSAQVSVAHRLIHLIYVLGRHPGFPFSFHSEEQLRKISRGLAERATFPCGTE